MLEMVFNTKSNNQKTLVCYYILINYKIFPKVNVSHVFLGIEKMIGRKAEFPSGGRKQYIQESGCGYQM
jgi:hypothetical protein